ncbi:hypothetical protein RRG08_058220 [Elysia crispata]|uniref:Fibrinogen C-terminal domain-containing protein n=1 Tax=Elysia crispata TaxID=231223 RepID=A0AAE1D5N0_9GAST|nr:hypothetical protein RRG08_058220 [Elysia crispata]
MGDDLTRPYPPYIVLNHTSLQRRFLCDTHTDSGGWLVIQRRAAGDVDFYKDWSSYRDGFGSPTGDHWLGNKAIHEQTDQTASFTECRLHADFMTVQGQLEDETDKYGLIVAICSDWRMRQTSMVLSLLSIQTGGGDRQVWSYRCYLFRLEDETDKLEDETDKYGFIVAICSDWRMRQTSMVLSLLSVQTGGGDRQVWFYRCSLFRLEDETDKVEDETDKYGFIVAICSDWRMRQTNWRRRQTSMVLSLLSVQTGGGDRQVWSYRCYLFRLEDETDKLEDETDKYGLIVAIYTDWRMRGGDRQVRSYRCYLFRLEDETDKYGFIVAICSDWRMRQTSMVLSLLSVQTGGGDRQVWFYRCYLFRLEDETDKLEDETDKYGLIVAIYTDWRMRQTSMVLSLLSVQTGGGDR